MSVDVKICGLSDPKTVTAAAEAGAAFFGFVFFRQSPRFVSPGLAGTLVRVVPRTARSVGLFVDPKDKEIAAALDAASLNMLQLHGKESPERVAEIRRRFGLPVIKAIAVSNYRDITAAGAYDKAADWLLFDAKPPPEATRPGGNAKIFDWTLLKSYTGSQPWLLAGGLTRANVAAAIRESGARAVDVSSGVETRPGVKSAAKIRAFINAAGTAS